MLALLPKITLYAGYMLRFFIKISMLFCIVMNVQISFAGSLYYKNKDLKAVLDSFSLAPSPISSHTKKIIEVQVSFILDQNPKSYDEIIKLLDAMPKHLRPTIVQAIVNVKGRGIAINKDYNFTPHPIIAEMNKIQHIFPVESQESYAENSDKTDILWSAYYITGNKEYLMRIVTFLSQFSKEVKIAAAEWKNTQMLDQFQKQLGVESSLEKEFIKELFETKIAFAVLAFGTVEWSLSANMHQYPEIKAAVEKIFEDNPELNFYKGIDS